MDGQTAHAIRDAKGLLTVVEKTQETVVRLSQYFATAEDRERALKLKEALRSLVDSETQLKKFGTALVDVGNEAKRRTRENVAGDAEDMAQLLRSKMQRVGGAGAGDALALRNHSRMSELREMCPLCDSEDDVDADEDEELTIVDTQDSNAPGKCPFLGTPYTLASEPMRSKVCKHRYSKQGIHSYLPHASTSKPCPVPGCPKTVQRKDLESDTVLVMRLEMLERNGGGTQ